MYFIKFYNRAQNDGNNVICFVYRAYIKHISVVEYTQLLGVF